MPLGRPGPVLSIISLTHPWVVPTCLPGVPPREG